MLLTVSTTQAAGAFAQECGADPLAHGPPPHSTPPAHRCASPANDSGWLDPGYMHHAVLPDVPSARLYYRFGSPAAGWSGTFSAAGQPAKGGDTKFLMFADVGMTQPVLFYDICPPYCPTGFAWSGERAGGSTWHRRLERCSPALQKLLSLLPVRWRSPCLR